MRISQSTGNIKGSITDDLKSPLQQVNIVLDKTNFNTTTNGKGEYIISNIPPGYYSIIISHIGYQSIKRDIIVKKNETGEFSYALQASTGEIPSVEVFGKEDYPTSPDYLRSVEQLFIRGKKMKFSCLTASDNFGRTEPEMCLRGYRVFLRGSWTVRHSNQCSCKRIESAQIVGYSM